MTFEIFFNKFHDPSMKSNLGSWPQSASYFSFPGLQSTASMLQWMCSGFVEQFFRYEILEPFFNCFLLLKKQHHWWHFRKWNTFGEVKKLSNTCEMALDSQRGPIVPSVYLGECVYLAECVLQEIYFQTKIWLNVHFNHQKNKSSLGFGSFRLLSHQIWQYNKNHTF